MRTPGPPRPRALELRQKPRAVADRRVAGVHRELSGSCRTVAPAATIDLSLQTKAVPQRQASDVGGTYITGSMATHCRGHSPLRSIARKWRAFASDKPESTRQSRREPQHDATGGQAASVVALTGARIVTMNGRATGDRERHDPRARQSHRRRRRELRRGNPADVAAAATLRPHRPARHHRCARAWTVRA